MDFKKIMQDYFGIALAVVMGVAVVTMYSSFTENLISIVTEKVTDMIQ